MTGLEIAVLLFQAAPAIASEAVSLWLRITNSDRVRRLPDGPEKEAEIQRVLAELRSGASSLAEFDRILAAP
jgi:hypothetical protein